MIKKNLKPTPLKQKKARRYTVTNKKDEERMYCIDGKDWTAAWRSLLLLYLVETLHTAMKRVLSIVLG